MNRLTLELFAQYLLYNLRLSLTASCAHHLSHEETQNLRLTKAVLFDFVGMIAQYCAHLLDQLGCIGNLAKTLLFDDISGLAT